MRNVKIEIVKKIVGIWKRGKRRTYEGVRVIWNALLFLLSLRDILFLCQNERETKTLTFFSIRIEKERKEKVRKCEV